MDVQRSHRELCTVVHAYANVDLIRNGTSKVKSINVETV